MGEWENYLKSNLRRFQLLGTLIFLGKENALDLFVLLNVSGRKTRIPTCP